MDRTRELKNTSSVRTILMFLIVLYHSLLVYGPGSWGPYDAAEAAPWLGELALWLNSFHVYGFALISGYVFYHGKYERGGYQKYLPFLLNKARRLLVPCAFIGAVWAAPVYACYYGTGKLVRKFLLGCSPSQLWFLLMLFWVFAIFWLLSDLADRRPVLAGVLVCGLYGLGMYAPQVYCFSRGLEYLLFFYAGFLIRKLDLGNRLLYRIPSLVYLGADLALYGFARFVEQRPGFLFRLLSLGSGAAVHLLGAVAAFAVLQRLADRIRESRVLEFFGRHSMAVYLVHQQLIYFSIGLLNGRVPPVLVVLGNFVISIGISTGFSLLMEKRKWTRFLLGSK